MSEFLGWALPIVNILCVIFWWQFAKKLMRHNDAWAALWFDTWGRAALRPMTFTEMHELREQYFDAAFNPKPGHPSVREASDRAIENAEAKRASAEARLKELES